MTDKSCKNDNAQQNFYPLTPPPQHDLARIDRELEAASGKGHRKRRVQESWMQESHLGGVLEQVPGFDSSVAFTHGLGPGSGVRELARAACPWLPERCLIPSGQRDVAGLRPESVFSVGDAWVQLHDTSRVPFRCICHLEITYEGGATAIGSGWLAGPDTVITAGHNVLNAEIRQWAQHIRVVPGRNGGTTGPYGESYGVYADALEGWKKKFDPDNDLGMLKIADKGLGSSTGWFGFAVFTNADLDQHPLIQSAGYPSLTRPYGTQWYDAGRAVRYSSAFLAYRVDTEEGQSGAPVFFTNNDGQRWVVATHVYGHTKTNLGRRVTDDTFDAIKTWVAA